MGASITPHQPRMSEPRVKKVKKKKNQEVYNAIVFTDFSLYKWTQEDLTEYKMKYVGYGLETCPKTEKEHHQGWLYAGTDAKRSFKSWKKVFKKLGLEKMHFERMLGNFAQNAKYISKEGKLVEVGIKPMGNGKKRTLLEYEKQIENGEAVLDIAEEEEKFGTYLQYRSGITCVFSSPSARKESPIVYPKRPKSYHLDPGCTYLNIHCTLILIAYSKVHSHVKRALISVENTIGVP